MHYNFIILYYCIFALLIVITNNELISQLLSCFERILRAWKDGEGGIPSGLEATDD